MWRPPSTDRIYLELDRSEMTAASKLIKAAQNGQCISLVRFCHLPDEMHTAIKGKAALQLGKAVIPAEVWMAKQTKHSRNSSVKTKGYLGPNSTTNINSVESHMAGRGWVPPWPTWPPPARSNAARPPKAKARASLTKKPSPAKRLERQDASCKGPDTIANSNTYQALLKVCKKWGLPTDTIAAPP